MVAATCGGGGDDGGGNFFRHSHQIVNSSCKPNSRPVGSNASATANVVASPPLPRIYWHSPGGTKTCNDRYRDGRQHSCRDRDLVPDTRPTRIYSTLACFQLVFLTLAPALASRVRIRVVSRFRFEEVPFREMMHFCVPSTNFLGRRMKILGFCCETGIHTFRYLGMGVILAVSLNRIHFTEHTDRKGIIIIPGQKSGCGDLRRQCGYQRVVFFFFNCQR